MIDEFENHCLENHKKWDTVVGIEARGFIVGAALAHALSCGFIPIRKPGTLPASTIAQEYTLETHPDAIDKGAKVLLVDDLLATGGTLLAAAD